VGNLPFPETSRGVTAPAAAQIVSELRAVRVRPSTVFYGVQFAPPLSAPLL
jgi:hypothetical protein